MRKPARSKCKVCNEWFNPAYSNVVWCCPDHGYEYSQIQLAKKKLDDERKRKQAAQQERRELKIRKKALQPLSKFHERAQTAFNAFIRQRDAGQPCISCERNSGAKMNAGHFRTVGASKETRYDETNCHLQCEACNSYLSGNIGEYRPRLIKKIGQEAFDRLMGPHEAKKWTREELDALAAHYRAKLKELKQQEAA